MKCHAHSYALAAALYGAVLGYQPRAAHALQPLRAFVESSKRNNPDNREAQATVEQRQAQRTAALASYLPSFTAQGTYTRNQYEAAFALPGGPTLTIQPHNGLDANLTVAVPIIDVGAWEQRRASSANLNVAEATRSNTQASVESSVTQAYFQLLGDEAVLFAAQQSVDAANANLRIVKDRRELGTASELDYQRGVVDVARAQRDFATAQQSVIASRRSLESLSRLAPEPAGPENYTNADDLHEETPLASWMTRATSDLVAVRPAVSGVEAAERSRTAAQAEWIPTLSAQGAERFTNAGGFTGRNEYFTLTATASWRFDFGLAPNVAAQTAAVSAARAREDKARRAAEDAIYQAWHQVSVGIEKARAAREEVKSASLAQDLARDRYAGGIATQLEVIQAQRDLFSSAVSRAQADFDLQYARASLRIAARRTTDQEQTQ